MKNCVLILAILGSVLAIATGACSGACLHMFDNTEVGEMPEGAQYLLLGLLQAIFGLIVGIMAYNKMNKEEKPSLFLKLGLFIAGLISITNTVVFITAGACHIIAGILVCVYKPTKTETKDT